MIDKQHINPETHLVTCTLFEPNGKCDCGGNWPPSPSLRKGSRVAFSVDPVTLGHVVEFRETEIVVRGDDGAEYRIDPNDLRARRLVPLEQRMGQPTSEAEVQRFRDELRTEQRNRLVMTDLLHFERHMHLVTKGLCSGEYVSTLDRDLRAFDAQHTGQTPPHQDAFGGPMTCAQVEEYCHGISEWLNEYGPSKTTDIPKDAPPPPEFRAIDPSVELCGERFQTSHGDWEVCGMPKGHQDHWKERAADPKSR